MLVAEGVQIFPCSRGSRFALPLDEHLTHPTGQSSAHNAFRLWLHGTMVNDRQRRWCSWWLAHPLLEEADVEDIMKLGAWRKSEADGPKKRGCSFPLGA